MKKRLSCLLAMVLMCSTLAACGGGTATPTASESTPPASESTPAGAAEDGGEEGETATETTPSSGGTLVLGEYILDTQMSTINPFLFARESTKQELLRYMYEQLMFFNPISGELEPALAESYEWNSDYTQLTYQIRTGVKWHDGQDFTPDDVVFTYETMRNEPVLDSYGLWNYIDTVTVEGNTVVFNLNDPLLSLPNYISDIYIVPKHIWEGVGEAAQHTNTQPIGTGPFMFKSYTTGTDVQFDANKDYWRGAPNVDSMVMMMYNSAPNVTLALLKGDIAATMGTLAMANTPEFMTKDNAEMQVYSGLSNFSVIVNHSNPLLADREVRYAMSLALNQQDLITKAEYNGVFNCSPGWLPELFGDLQNPAVMDYLEYSSDKAMEVLEAAGYEKGSDGIYAKDGQRLSFTYHNASGAPAQQMEAGMIQQWLLNVGIEIIPRLATWPELTQMLITGEYDLLQNSIGFPADPQAALNTVFHSSMTAPVGTPAPGRNYFRYENAELDALLEEAGKATEDAQRKDLYHQIQAIIAEDVVFLPMYNVGGHIPYYDGGRYSGWIDDAPILDSTRGQIAIYEIQ